MKKLSILALLLISTVSLFAQTVTVSANLKTIFNTNQATKAKICFSLVDATGQAVADPHVVGTGVLVQTDGVCLSPDANGLVSTNLLANDQIVAGGVPDSTLYSIQYLYNSSPTHGALYHFALADGAASLNTKAPANITPLVTPTLSDAVYMRLDAGNSPAAQPWTFPGIVDTGTLNVTGATTLNSGTLNGTFGGNPTFSGNALIGGTLGVTGAATFGGGVPWYDATFFGAKCDSVTDDTTAIQAAAAAAALIGDNVAIPDGKTCVIATSSSPALNLDLMRHTAIISGVPSGRSRPGGGIDHISTLKFTGTPAIALSARGSFGVALNGVAIQATNAAFTGTLIDVSHLSTDTGCGGSPCDSQNFFLLNSTVSGVGSGCTIGLSLDKAIKFTVENSNFFGCVSLLKGASASGSYSNVGTIKHNEFSASAGVTGFIVNPGESWAVSNNTFETNAASVNTLGNSGGFADTTALEFSSNWDGDDTGAGAYTKYVLPANTVAHFSGNTITATHNNVTGVSIGNNSEVTFEDNNFNGGSTFGTLFSLGTGDILHVGPQQYGTLSAFMSGTPASGSDVVDNTGKKTVFGTVGFTGQIQSTIATGTAPLTIASTTSVATLTVSNHPQIRSCQGANPCANASTTGQLIAYDGGANYTLSGGTLTVTGFPYTANNSFGCWAWDTTNAANKVIPTNNSGASVTFAGTTTDTFKFLCIGN